MHLVTKHLHGREYFYLIEKARRNGHVVTRQTIYLGTRRHLAQLLTAARTAPPPCAVTPQEFGASLALVRVAQSLDLEQTLDRVLRPRFGGTPVGRWLLITMIHGVLAAPGRKSKRWVRSTYETGALNELLPVDPTGLDARRLGELLRALTVEDIERLETTVVHRLLTDEKLELRTLAFDTTNFDSWCDARTPSRLLKLGHAKSHRPLRVLGLGLLMASNDALPLLTFSYPGNQNDHRAFRRFLRELDRRQAALRLPVEATIVADGGNLSARTLNRFERQHRHYVFRLPAAHAGTFERWPVEALSEVSDDLGKGTRARKAEAEVYGRRRCVVDVYSRRMRDKQWPGLLRDFRHARQELEELQRQLNLQRAGRRRAKPLTQADVERRVAAALRREHMHQLFNVHVGCAAHPLRLDWSEREQGWEELERFVLGRTLLVTDRHDWSVEETIRASRAQASNEAAFRDLKDPEFLSLQPMRHRRDAALRSHAFLVVTGLLLCRLLVRRARHGGYTATSTASALRLLQGIMRAGLVWPSSTGAGGSQLPHVWVPCTRTPEQTALLRALGLEAAVGTTPPEPQRLQNKADRFS